MRHPRNRKRGLRFRLSLPALARGARQRPGRRGLGESLRRLLARGKNTRRRRPAPLTAPAATTSNGETGGSAGGATQGAPASPARQGLRGALVTFAAAGRGGLTALGRGLGRLAAALTPLAAALVAFATPTLGVRAYDYVMETGYFHVREVLVEGNERLSNAEVLEAAGIRPGTHVLAADLQRMAARLRAHPWISWAHVRRELPARLLIELREERPVALLADGPLYLVNAAGEIFAPLEPQTDTHLPIVTGLSAAVLTGQGPAAEVARGDLRAAVNLARLYRSMNLDGRWPLSEVRVIPGRGLGLVLSGSGTNARLGRGPYRAKLYRLEWVLEHLRQQGKEADYVLLDVEGHEGEEPRVVVKAEVAPSQREIAEEAAAHAVSATRSPAHEAEATAARPPGHTPTGSPGRQPRHQPGH